MIGFHFLDGAFQLTNIVFKPVCHVFNDIIVQFNSQKFCFSFDDGDARFKIRRLHICSQSPFKAGQQSLFKRCNIFWRAITGEHNLFFCLIQSIECVEKFFLSGVLAGNKLYIVHQQDICVAVAVVKFRGGSFLNGINQFICKLIAFDVNNIHAWTVLFDFMANCIQQVGLTEAGVSINKKRIIKFSWFCCNS